MPALRTIMRPWLVATLLCLIYMVFVLLQNNGDPLAFVTIGTRFSQGIPDGSEGYDGQFNYYIARDPSTAAQFIDVPAYRFQRILFPLLGRVLALGQESLIPWAFLLINLVSLAVGTYLLEKLLIGHGVSRWYAITYGLTLGIFGSLRLSLSEPLAYALVIGGITLAHREKWLWSALLFALAALAKETSLFFPAAYTLYLLYKRQWRIAIPFTFIGVLPFAIWQLILRNQFGEFGIGSGGALSTSFEVIPFAGVIRILTDSPAEARAGLLFIFGAILLPFVLVPVVWALWRCWVDMRTGNLSTYWFLMLVNAAILLFVPLSTYREPIGILRFIVGLQIVVILYTAHEHCYRALRNTTIWALTILFIFALV
ncbi:MAG: glycosyltransferase 87 family protein [Anaerolineae bacterium]|nr:glycosyltransferase 87 family protein [Anaerolineae bacterium]